MPRLHWLDGLPTLAAFLLLGLALAWLLVVAITFHRLTRPPRRTYATALAQSRPGDPSELVDPPSSWSSWALRTDDALDLPVWDIAGSKPAGPVLVLTPGWGDARVGALARAAPLLPHVSRAILWDTRGQGDAPARSTCALGTREVDDLVRLVERAHPAQPIVLFGWSMGAGVSIAAASRRVRSVAGVIAEAPYIDPVTPARRVLRDAALPAGSTLRAALALVARTRRVDWRTFDRAGLAADLPVPLLVLHGELDAVSPIDHGRTIAAAAPRGEIVEFPGLGHFGMWTQPPHADRAAREVAEFLARVAPTGDSISS